MLSQPVNEQSTTRWAISSPTNILPSRHDRRSMWDSVLFFWLTAPFQHRGQTVKQASSMFHSHIFSHVICNVLQSAGGANIRTLIYCDLCRKSGKKCNTRRNRTTNSLALSNNMYLFKVELIAKTCLSCNGGQEQLEIFESWQKPLTGENDQQPARDKAAMWIIRARANMSYHRCVNLTLHWSFEQIALSSSDPCPALLCVMPALHLLGL